MRIIGGSAKGRRLRAPGRQFGLAVRPTSDRAREALFNIIRAEVAAAAVLDLFAGTGALGLEALSRGAASVLFVESDRAVAELIHCNAELCGFADRTRLVARDLSRGISFLKALTPPGGFDLVFLDPPYGHGLAEKVLTELPTLDIVKQSGLLVAEAGSKETLPAMAGPFGCVDQRRYGETGFWLYRAGENGHEHV